MMRMFSFAKILIRRIKDKFVFYSPSMAQEDAKQRWQRLQDDIGAFEYEEQCFHYPFENGASVIHWADVNRIVGYKLDLMTTDEICLELHIGDRAVRFSESTPGWYQFLDRLQVVFPTIPRGWDLDIIQPPMATNYTFLYERGGSRLPRKYNFQGSIRPIPFAKVCEAFEKEGWVLRSGQYIDQMDASNSWSDINLVKDNKGVVLMGRIAFRPGAAEAIDRVLYATGGKFKYEFYGEDKEVLWQKRWP